MGYTHYTRRRAVLPEKKWAKAVADCKTVCEKLMNEGLVLVEDYDKTTPPVFDGGTGHVWFNGLGEDDGHETFVVVRDMTADADDKGWAFSFCKTARKPYDLAVCCCLIVFAHHFRSQFKVSSDGGDDEQNWPVADEACRKVLGYGKEFELDAPERIPMAGLKLGTRYADQLGGWASHLGDGLEMKAVRPRYPGGYGPHRKRMHLFVHHAVSNQRVEVKSEKEGRWWATVQWWRDKLKEFVVEGKDGFLKEMLDTRSWLPLMVMLDLIEETYGEQNRLRRHIPLKVSGARL